MKSNLSDEKNEKNFATSCLFFFFVSRIMKVLVTNYFAEFEFLSEIRRYLGKRLNHVY